MSDLRELYQEVILDHNRKPHNFSEPPQANRKAIGYNPLCGDQLTVFLELQGGKIQDIGFQGSGCAISKASASMMTDALKGKTSEEVKTIFNRFHRMVTGDPGDTPDPDLGKLAVFSGVCEFPSRVKCASLAWHTVKAAMEGNKDPISTEKDA